ncbi:MAG: DNA translocase FtsK 4TM domain-containing protein, partial [Clostridiales bacterium]|nr:DNA translocase FtsK 4TM domain-containing protein [Clostridiales bacterium]
MASKKQTTTSNASSRQSGRKQTSAAKKGTKSSAPRKQRDRAWLCPVVGLLLLLLAAFSALSCFQVDAILLNALSMVAGGLLGYGFFLVPLALGACGVLLLLHKRFKRLPLKLALVPLVAVCISAVCHTVAGSMELGPGPLAAVAGLWQTGVAHKSGGVLGGLLAVGLVKLVSRIGSILVLALLLFVCLLLLTDTTPDRAFQKAAQLGAGRKRQPRKRSAPKQEPEVAPVEQLPQADPATGEVVESPRF